eukprot:CAMPEP_0119408148 /NCGR_PEP_ID=MMETSP1335-20130426/1791_1 /TAXON_ID=259385 /ORGANISM="Chrysoculter rhomboideus, Strain RCC1486" /LENGTH=51 /DNA_ID=CAMNT_0007432347 /DNA_START=71 /DNA_END=222 /DNA_ORIENTATION=+
MPSKAPCTVCIRTPDPTYVAVRRDGRPVRPWFSAPRAQVAVSPADGRRPCA